MPVAVRGNLMWAYIYPRGSQRVKVLLMYSGSVLIVH